MAVKHCYCGVKLSPNKKSIFGLRTQILSLLFAACFVAGVFGADTEVSCPNVKTIFESKGMLSAADLQDQPYSDAGGLCLTQGCCGPQANALLSQQARTQLEKSLRNELVKLAETLSNKARKFDDFFRKLLQQSREDFHAMFKRTYGMIYEQHSYVFEKLFEQLERYYERGDTDLDNMMESFFGILYQKMFTVLNSQYNFDEKYLKCVNEHMKETQPFEDVPKKLSVQLRRAFVATRTFHKALRAGADVIRHMLQVGVTPECTSSWARLRHCGTCSSQSPPACSRYCHNVLRGCLPAHADLTQQWDAYVDGVEKVADRLIGPFNIVMVVEPIDIKISEAIMTFQEHNQEISQKIFQGCGKPVLGGGGGAGPFFAPGRTRRSIQSPPEFDWNQKSNDVDDFELETSFETLLKEDPSLYSLSSKKDIDRTAKKMAEQAEDRQRFLQYMRGDIDAEEYEEHERRRRDAEPEPAGASAEIDYRAFDFDKKRGGKKNKKPVSSSVDTENRNVRDWGSAALARLVRDTRSRVRSSRHYWGSLPYVLCNEDGVAAAPSHAACFNGTGVAAYILPAAGEGSAALASNPEVRGLVSGSQIVSAQQEALRVLTGRLKDAYNGVEVQWKDDDDQQPSGSDFIETAGSGSGSGDDGYDLPDDDEDRVPGNEYPASGQGPPDEESSPAPPEPTEPPFTPVVLSGNGETRNVNLGPVGAATDNEPRSGTIEETIPVQNTPVRQPPANSAERPSLRKAIFTYAFPVVCAWFGGIITDFI